MRRRAGIVLAAAIWMLAAVARPAEEPIAVIVHPSRSGSLDVDEVARIFLRRQRFWPDGAPVVPLNRQAGNDLREAFTRRVFGVSTSGLAGYWNEQYFLGTFPPATLSSSAAVKRYVSADRNAIGYVERSAVDDGVAVVLVLGPGRH